jgi:hypothetical protein
VEWDNILADNDGRYVLKFRYSSVGDRTCELLVNGQKSGTIAFKDTKKSTAWKTVNIDVKLKSGGNFVKVVAMDAGLNLDAVAVNK